MAGQKRGDRRCDGGVMHDPASATACRCRFHRDDEESACAEAFRNACPHSLVDRVPNQAHPMSPSGVFMLLEITSKTDHFMTHRGTHAES